MLNSKEETVLVQTLITHIISLNEEIERSEEKLKINMRSLRELDRKNTKLKDRLNSLYSKIDAHNLVKEITT